MQVNLTEGILFSFFFSNNTMLEAMRINNLQNATGYCYAYQKGQPSGGCGVPNNRVQEGAKVPSQEPFSFPDNFPIETDPDTKIS